MRYVCGHAKHHPYIGSQGHDPYGMIITQKRDGFFHVVGTCWS